MREPGGTGKTLAAEVTPAEQRLSLYRIDLGAVVSKFIGETEKSLDRVFADAAAAVALLFFDEADALFGRRSEMRDPQDRYPNMEPGYPPQRLETSDSLVILATGMAVVAVLGLCLIQRSRRPRSCLIGSPRDGDPACPAGRHWSTSKSRPLP